MFCIELFTALNRHRVDYVTIGGLAVYLHGVERAVTDIDITVAMTPDNLSALITAARELSLRPVWPVDLEVLHDSEKLARWREERFMAIFTLRAPGGYNSPTVDLLVFPPVDFAGLSQRAVELRLKDTPIIVASIDDLIILKKILGRPKDRSDAKHLQRLKTP